MEAKDAIDLKLVKTDLEATDKDDILRELATLLYEEGKVTDVDGFLKDVYAREAEGQTGIGNYVAIPHGKSEFVSTSVVAIGVNKSEIPWETLDGNGVKVVILFAVGNDAEAAKEHLKLLSLFARKLGNDQVVSSLLKATNPTSVYEAFQ
ncbi:PTS sugar transporter subunit IIA [Streptococcus gallinaceus]|uniref:PTS system fructose-specific IIA component n=1 Tax=Streptococcus gallinaceus TaxID=165758 RepID=A0ABV2JM05_9STRE|nr:fructose PTS transporter subunit IIA [Streptococcus gallinaceus]MCP1639869.1 PTS system fructose-specific IIA component [Streptococcus gallinaceus]MCP1770759.1 PTS system fructose-specific IIA component [Streptococcus gallinaceus]